MTALNCPICRDLCSGEFWDSVVCDGCHKWVHRACAGPYVLISVTYSDTPRALLFCKDCEEVE